MFSPRVAHAIRTAARHVLYRELLEDWLRRDPGQAHAAIRYIKEVTHQDVRDGKWQNTDAGAQLAIRFPTDLFFLIRRAIPGWGDDTADLKDFLREFPDLIPSAMQKRIGLHRDGQRERRRRHAETVSQYVRRTQEAAELDRKGRPKA